MSKDSYVRHFKVGLGRILTTALLVGWWGTAAQMAQAANAWDDDPAVQEVLEIRRLAILAMTTTGPTPESERYSTTFVANTPGGGVVNGKQMQEAFARGLSYAKVEMKLDYAGSHGPDMVVLMGEEIVVAGEGARNAGVPVRRRFTDVFRKEDGEWRHDVRQSAVITGN